MLISAKETFDYIEGFVIINRTGLLNNWRSSFDPQDPARASQFDSDGKILFCLEMTKNFNRHEAESMSQVYIYQYSACMKLNIPEQTPDLWIDISYRKSNIFCLSWDTYNPRFSNRRSPIWSSWIESMCRKWSWGPKVCGRSHIRGSTSSYHEPESKILQRESLAKFSQTATMAPFSCTHLIDRSKQAAT